MASKQDSTIMSNLDMMLHNALKANDRACESVKCAVSRKGKEIAKALKPNGTH